MTSALEQTAASQRVVSSDLLPVSGIDGIPFFPDIAARGFPMWGFPTSGLLITWAALAEILDAAKRPPRPSEDADEEGDDDDEDEDLDDDEDEEEDDDVEDDEDEDDEEEEDEEFDNPDDDDFDDDDDDEDDFDDDE